MPTKPALIDLTGDSDTAAPAAASSKPTRHKSPHTKQKILSFLRLHRSPTAPAHFQLSQLHPTPALALANASTQLINTTMVDRGWACGYRNCQMLLSSLLADTRYHMHERFPCSVPSVRALQECLELAWRDGFDPDGAEQMGRRVVGGRKWVGTTEIYCILAHFGVPARIVDFHRPTAADGTNPMLFAWMVEYFIASEGGSAGGIRFICSIRGIAGRWWAWRWLRRGFPWCCLIPMSLCWSNLRLSISALDCATQGAWSSIRSCMWMKTKIFLHPSMLFQTSFRLCASP
ncbi:peptidase family C78-domain-containing protein, partial [Kickxella alabastrina]|uniref:peptidase family C78-domain-containing protein n=1 Tax=Kickxella alabastrina TaxID=61397 RepID=UPI0022200E3A